MPNSGGQLRHPALDRLPSYRQRRKRNEAMAQPARGKAMRRTALEAALGTGLLQPSVPRLRICLSVKSQE